MTASNRRKIIKFAIAAELVLIACMIILKISHAVYQFVEPLYFLSLAGGAIIAILLLFRAVDVLYLDKRDVRH